MGVVVFPGTWSDCDFHYVISEMQPVKYVWHRDREVDDLDRIVLPGGRTATTCARARGGRRVPWWRRCPRSSRVVGSSSARATASRSAAQAGLLPGALMRNECLQYRCHLTHVVVDNVETPLTRALRPGQVPLQDGRSRTARQIPRGWRGRAALRARNQIVFRYATAEGKITKAANPQRLARQHRGNCQRGRDGAGPHAAPRAGVPSRLWAGTDGLLLFHSLLGSLVEDGTFSKR